MTRAIVTLILTMCAVAVVVEVHNRPQNAGLPIVKASAQLVPWRLYSTCPADHRNVPVLPSKRIV